MSRLRQGMWVIAEDGQVGVINAFMRGNRVEFHRVGVEGLTEIAIVVEAATLTQAAYEDIPESRRPDFALAKVLGYL